jgi:uncharacterized protein (DUF58 family)
MRASSAERIAYDRVRITRVGVWYIIATLVVGVAAANTGNNSLYLVEAMLLALLAVSGLASRRNLRAMRLEVSAPDEIFAKQPFSLRYRLASRDRLLAKRLLLLFAGTEVRGHLVPFLAKGEEVEGRLSLLRHRRGLFRIPVIKVSSIFPLGLFQKTMRFPVDLELLIFPEINPVGMHRLTATGRTGEEASAKAGWGHELLSLRAFRPGDDPRGIHWKQTARTGELVYMERESEQGRRLSVVLDNAVGELSDDGERDRFEGLVSEAASVADHHLENGYEVELVTRDGVLPFAGGKAQRLRILETLALVEARPATDLPLLGDDRGVPRLRLGMAS